MRTFLIAGFSALLAFSAGVLVAQYQVREANGTVREALDVAQQVQAGWDQCLKGWKESIQASDNEHGTMPIITTEDNDAGESVVDDVFEVTPSSSRLEPDYTIPACQEPRVPLEACVPDLPAFPRMPE